MAQDELKTFAEFWPFYVAEHSRTATRVLHGAGTLAGSALFVAALLTGRWWLVVLALVSAYGAAWVGHFFVEHNRPASFQHPLWSFIADYKMLALMLTRRMGKELARLHLD
jgi:hypothetical protein